jgi:hypothetical protein
MLNLEALHHQRDPDPAEEERGQERHRDFLSVALIPFVDS